MGLTSVDAAVEQCLKKCLPEGALGAVTGDTARYMDCLVECLGNLLITEAVGRFKWRKILEEQSPKIKEMFAKLDEIRQKWLKSKAIDIINGTPGGARLKSVADYPSELEDLTIEELIELLKGKDSEKAKKARKLLKLIEQAGRLVEKGKKGNLKSMLPRFDDPPQEWRLIEGLLDQLNFARAAAELEAVLGRAGPAVPSSNLLLLQANLLMLSDDSHTLGDIEDRLKSAVAANPQDAAAQLELGLFLDGWRDRPEDAEPMFRAAYGAARANLGDALVGLFQHLPPASPESVHLARDARAFLPEIACQLQIPVWATLDETLYQLVTDAGRPINHTTTPVGPGAAESFERQKKLVEDAGGYVFAPARTGANCHGYTFDRGESEIPEAQVRDTILPDNYTRVDLAQGAQADVCDVIVYGSPIADHSGLVVEVDAAGKPTKIISKWGPSGGVFVHPPQAGPYGGDWEIHRRKTGTFDAAKNADIAALRKAYDAEAAHGRSTPKAHLLAYALCRAKNALQRD